MAPQRERISGRQKAAILLISLGTEVSSKIFQHLPEDEIEQVSLEIANTHKIAPENKDRVFEEFHQLALAQEYINQGGIEYAKELLEKALGSTRAVEVLHRLTATLQVRPFDFVRKTDPSQLSNFIQNEHPQTIALVLAYLEPQQASVVLSSLPPDRQADVARRIAKMDSTSPDIIREVEKVLERKLSSLVTQDYASAGGVEAVVQLLAQCDRATEKVILESLEVADPELAEEIRKRMFVFEDIILLDDKSVQVVLREIDLSKDLPLAIKVASEDVKAKVYRNLSKRAAENLRENLDYLGPVRLRDIEEAQQKIVNIIRKLEDEGQVIVARGGGDEVVV